MRNQKGNTTVIAAILGLAVGVAVGWYLGTQQAGIPAAMPVAKAPVPAARKAEVAEAPALPPAKYGFEADKAIGWTCGDYERAQACKGVGHSNELHKEGLSALKFEVDLSATSERRSSGEVWVDVGNVPPEGETGPLNLANRTVTMWVYATPGSAGEAEHPNGFQLFVKDGNWKAKYGPWQDVQEGQWTELSFPVGGPTEGFDPTRINAIGLKLASGDGSKAKFAGSIYVDAVSW